MTLLSLSSRTALLAVLLGAAAAAQAQTAGSWLVRAGFTQITPNDSSTPLSAPSLPDTRLDVEAASQISGGVTYMVTDNFALDLPLALPFKHKINGAGAIVGSGQIAEVSALPFTLFAQYRFLAPDASVRPYVGLGLTYAYFLNETGSGKLTAMTNPGGAPTKVKVDSQWALTPQIGVAVAIDKRWGLDVMYSRTTLKTKQTLSTGQTQDITLDPDSFSIGVTYRF